MRTKEQEAQRAMRRLMWWYRRPFLRVLDWLEDGHVWVLCVFGATFILAFIALTIGEILKEGW